LPDDWHNNNSLTFAAYSSDR